MPHKDPEARRAYIAAYWDKNRERLNAQSRKRWAENGEKYKATSAKWRDANREKLREGQRDYYARNREMIRVKQAAYQKAHPELYKVKNRRSRLAMYGMTIEQYRDHLVGQAGRCLICLRVPVEDLAVDHDHKTGAVRGLLCRNCNGALGLLADDTARMQRAIAYVS